MANRITLPMVAAIIGTFNGAISNPLPVANKLSATDITLVANSQRLGADDQNQRSSRTT